MSDPADEWVLWWAIAAAAITAVGALAMLIAAVNDLQVGVEPSIEKPRGER